MSTTEDGQPLGLGLGEGLGPTLKDQLAGLLVALRTRFEFMSNDGVRWYMTQEPDRDCTRAAEVLESMRAVGLHQERLLMDAEAELARLRTELLRAREDVKLFAAIAEGAKMLATLEEHRAERAARLGLGPNVPLTGARATGGT